MNRPGLTQERLQQVVSYDPESGNFCRLESASNSKAGPMNPKASPVGYLRARIDGRLYTLHRLAWLYVNGQWPRGVIDHINGNKTDNRILNLRDATSAVNALNSNSSRAPSSGRRGVYWHKKSRAWQAKIGVGGRSKSLGYFKDVDSASKAYEEARTRLLESPE